jgi:hypothetical protein
MKRSGIVERNLAAYYTGLAKVAVQCSADTFVVKQSLVLRINTCLPAGRFVVKITNFAKPENVSDKRKTNVIINLKQYCFSNVVKKNYMK